jgi:acyl-coenzyme A thioesterase PaaI-like protein
MAPAMRAPDDEELRFPDDGGCFGCSPSHPAGLRLTFRRRGDVVTTRYAIPDRFHGARGIAHGGIVATVLDEVSCAAVFFVRGSAVVTGELSVRYVKPCPVERPLDVAGRITGEHPRYAVVETEIRDGDVVLARSTGKFFYQARKEPAP